MLLFLSYTLPDLVIDSSYLWPTIIVDNRATYACCRIQGIIRGFLSRLRTKQLLIYWRAAIVIQRVIRGKLGRIRWMRLYWLTRAVVKSDTALKDLILRSSLLRRDYKKGMNGNQPNPSTNTNPYP